MRYFAPTKLSENISETPEGYLLCIGVPICRTGEQLYGEGETPLETGDDGKIVITRDPKDVLNPDTIASYEGKAVTINHPEDFVGPDNWSDLAKGIMQNIRKAPEKDENGEDSLLADLLITDALAIKLVKAGLREVSCGYEAEYEQTGKGKGKQTGIIGNHLALVQNGRAGSTYAINDHKWKGLTMKEVADKMKRMFGRAVDEAMKEDKKDDKAKDADEEKKDESKDDGMKMYDELKSMMKDMSDKIDAMKPKDAAAEEKKDDEKKADDADEEKKEDESKDDEASLEERLKALETAVAKLLEKKTGDDEEKSDESQADDEEKSEDDDFEESSMTGDAARAEIIAPGIKAEKKEDIKKKALETAYGTKEGKEVIHAFTGGKKPVLDSAEKIQTLFIGVSEVLKASRGNGLERTKDGKNFETGDNKAEVMTAEKMNEKNAAHWARK